MSQDSQKETLFKSPKRLIIALIAGFLIPIATIGLLISYVRNISLPNAGTDAMSASAITQRIAPVAQVAIQEMPASAASEVADNATSASPTAADSANGEAIAAAIAAIPSAASMAAKSKAGPADAAQAGKALYTQICQTCHATGLLSAPKFGNKADWAPRLKSPVSEIYQYALQGKGSMPPKGGSNASDEEIKAAVDYMLKAVK